MPRNPIGAQADLQCPLPRLLAAGSGGGEEFPWSQGTGSGGSPHPSSCSALPPYPSCSSGLPIKETHRCPCCHCCPPGMPVSLPNGAVSIDPKALSSWGAKVVMGGPPQPRGHALGFGPSSHSVPGSKSHQVPHAIGSVTFCPWLATPQRHLADLTGKRDEANPLQGPPLYSHELPQLQIYPPPPQVLKRAPRTSIKQTLLEGSCLANKFISQRLCCSQSG